MGVVTIFVCGTILFTMMLEALRHQLDHRLRKKARDGNHVAIAAQELVLALYKELSVLGLVSCASFSVMALLSRAIVRCCRVQLVLRLVLLYCP